MVVGVVEVDAADLVGAREEEDALVADAAAAVVGQLHHVRTVAAEGAVEAQQTQVRTAAVVRAARVGRIARLPRRVQNLSSTPHPKKNK